MSKKRKHAITLIEVLISLALLTILLGSLFFWYQHLSARKGKLEALKAPYLEEQHLCQRLDRIFPTAAPPFFADGDGVVFRFDRGLAGDPLLSDTVLGKLYHNSDQKTLCLGIWPDLDEEEPIRTPSMTLTLIDQVEACTFEFYAPPDPHKLIVDPDQVGKPRPKEGWNKEKWIYADTLPAFVKLNLKRLDKNLKPPQNNREVELYFDLNVPIMYPKESA